MDLICDKILCVQEKPKEPWKLFFGDTGHFIRVDRVDYPVFQRLYEKGFADFWTWKVVDFSKDRIGWDSLPENAKRMFLLNNGYQTLMDSGVYNSYFDLLKITSNSELATLYGFIGQQEQIHANSYSYGLSQMFGHEAEEKIDIVYQDEFIKKRLENEVNFEYELYSLVKQNIINNNTKKALLKTIYATYYLEHTKFPFSFNVTWSINDAFNNAIQGFSQILKLIAYDELTTHTPTNMNVLKILMREDRQGFKHLKSWFEDFVYSYTEEQAKIEKEWNEYLHKDGSIPGFTNESGNYFIEYMADKTLKDLGLEPIFKVKKTSLIDWFNNYYDINKQQNASQELSNISYQKGVLKNDLNKLNNINEISNLENIVQII